VVYLFGEKEDSMAYKKIVDVLKDEDAITLSFTGDNVIGSKRLYTKFTATLNTGSKIQDSMIATKIIKDSYKGIQ